MIFVDTQLKPADLRGGLHTLWQASAAKIRSLESAWCPESGAPVFTIKGKYTSRGWTEWTQGFQFGAPILQFDATGETEFLNLGRERTRRYMAPHITHVGVHDHGFNNVSTYGNLLRLMREGSIAHDPWEEQFYILALQCTGAVQAARWSTTADGNGYIYSFNGPHSLFVDTMRTLRALSVSHRLGHVLMGENDRKISLLERMIQHARVTAEHVIFYGEGRDAYDLLGRTAHEIIFNRNDGNKRCPSSQQGYSPFSTWTRGLAWAMLGYAEQLEFLETEPGDLGDVKAFMVRAAKATCDFYLEHSPTDGIPYWDTGAPGLAQMGHYLDRPAEPFNDHEPVDSSAAAIAAQGLLRLGKYLDEPRYWQAGLSTARTLLGEPYLSTDPNHQGLLLHSVYHRPNGWDHIPDGRKVPCGESCMWGDYHLRELAVYLGRIIDEKPYLTFWS